MCSSPLPFYGPSSLFVGLPNGHSAPLCNATQCFLPHTWLCCSEESINHSAKDVSSLEWLRKGCFVLSSKISTKVSPQHSPGAGSVVPVCSSLTPQYPLMDFPEAIHSASFHGGVTTMCDLHPRGKRGGNTNKQSCFPITELGTEVEILGYLV